MLKRASDTVNITIEEFVSAKKESSYEVVIPETGISWDISTIGDVHGREGFHWCDSVIIGARVKRLLVGDMWRVEGRKHKVVQCKIQREREMGSCAVHVILGSNLSSIIFLRNYGCIIQKGGGVTRSIIFRSRGRTTTFYVNGSIIRLGSHLFIVLIHSNFSKKEYIC